jgi:hypothetical protein
MPHSRRPDGNNVKLAMLPSGESPVAVDHSQSPSRERQQLGRAKGYGDANDLSAIDHIVYPPADAEQADEIAERTIDKAATTGGEVLRGDIAGDYSGRQRLKNGRLPHSGKIETDHWGRTTEKSSLNFPLCTSFSFPHSTILLGIPSHYCPPISSLSSGKIIYLMVESMRSCWRV